eukprot:Nk52_evm15s262 gene=Nk52_evmTU15s262
MSEDTPSSSMGSTKDAGRSGAGRFPVLCSECAGAYDGLNMNISSPQTPTTSCACFSNAQAPHECIHSLLMQVITKDHLQCLEALLFSGICTANMRIPRFTTCLHMSTYFGRVGCARILIEGGANRSARDEEGRTAIDLILKGEDDDEEIYNPKVEGDARLDNSNYHNSSLSNPGLANNEPAKLERLCQRIVRMHCVDTGEFNEILQCRMPTPLKVLCKAAMRQNCSCRTVELLPLELRSYISSFP